GTTDDGGDTTRRRMVGRGGPHGGYHLVAAAGGGTVGGGNTLTVNPAITSRSPDHGNPGNSVTVYGAGFAANSTVTVTLGGTAVTGSVASSSGNGQVSNLQFTVPAGFPVGATTITVTDAGGNSASIGYTVYHAGIATTQTSAVANGSVTVTGAGWPPSQNNIQVWLGPVGSGNFIGYVNSDASGNISQSLNVGQGIPHGTYPLNATDSADVGGGERVGDGDRRRLAAEPEQHPGVAGPSRERQLPRLRQRRRQRQYLAEPGRRAGDPARYLHGERHRQRHLGGRQYGDDQSRDHLADAQPRQPGEYRDPLWSRLHGQLDGDGEAGQHHG